MSSARSAKAVMQQHARSFWLAAGFLPEQQVQSLARLYAFCRHADDLADATPAGINAGALAELRAAISTSQPACDLTADLLRLQTEHRLPNSVLLDFVDALIADQYPRRLTTVDELVRFAYGVASTVGLLICSVLGVRERSALPFAMDLGIAMQITNVCRDVLEDAERGRVYIPSELAGIGLDPSRLCAGDPVERSAALRAVHELLHIAEGYYASAERGIRYLPRAVRPGILVAARVYREIGREILRRPQSYWQSRTVVSGRRKGRVALKAVFDSLFKAEITGRMQPRPHDPTLHLALRERHS